MELYPKIRSKEELLNLFGSSKKLEINDLQQMKDLLEMNIPLEVLEDASNRNLLTFDLELVKRTNKFKIQHRSKLGLVYLVSFLTCLIELDLFSNCIFEISPISKLKNLQILKLSQNYFANISALEQLTELTELYIANCGISSFTLALPNLVKIDICENPLKDQSGLKHSPKLQHLELTRIHTINLDSTIQLPNLTKLFLSWNQILNINFISNFINLQYLDLDYVGDLKSLEPLKYCVQLKELWMNNIISITDIKPLRFLKQLKILILNSTLISDIWPLQFLKKLKELKMRDMYTTEVMDLHPLQRLYKLQKVAITNAHIIDVSPLARLTQLKKLQLKGNKIQNFNPIKHHKQFPNQISVQLFNSEDEGEEESWLTNEDEEDEKREEYDLSKQKLPTVTELKFYNKILKVHSTHRKIRKIQNKNKIQKFRISLTLKKNCISTMLNNQIMIMSNELDLLVQFIQNSNTYLD
ncbi:leucine-rich_repeat domain-containing protein [Hexamita inflata]|uniref:Leucine-rich repeat domain-containing protein n=1 Tax=Hexamita inflata TaxID=28002 RepID=A0AA86QVT8_9EUKA|nr:leucine-rich repeat domain-containing protein [Hexamita inflata]